MERRMAPGVRRPAPAAAPSRAAPAAARPAAAPARTAARTRPAGRPAFYRGEEAYRKVDEEAAKAKARAEARKNQTNMPFRFRVPVNETRQVVVLDDAPDFFQYEHTLKGPDGYWNLHTGCIKESDVCPVCESVGKESTYCMYLTVLDLTPFETRNGEEVPFSRKLFVVKNQQQKKIMRMYQREGTLRGAVLDCTRDGDKEPQIGNDIELNSWMEEADLATYQREWTDRERKRHVEDCSVPFDYEALFEEPTAEKLRAVVGGRPTPGSRESNRAALRPQTRRDRDDWEQPDAQGEYAEGAEEPARPAPARRSAPVPRTAVRPAAAPARTVARRPAPPVEEEAVEDEGYVEGEEVVEGEDYVEGAEVDPGEEAAEEAPPVRRGPPVTRRPAPAPAAAPVRRGPPVASRPVARPAAPVRRPAPAAEPEYEDEQPPVPRRVAVRRSVQR